MRRICHEKDDEKGRSGSTFACCSNVDVIFISCIATDESICCRRNESVEEVVIGRSNAWWWRLFHGKTNRWNSCKIYCCRIFLEWRGKGSRIRFLQSGKRLFYGRRRFWRSEIGKYRRKWFLFLWQCYAGSDNQRSIWWRLIAVHWAWTIRRRKRWLWCLGWSWRARSQTILYNIRV